MRQLVSKPCRICGAPVSRKPRNDRKAFWYPRQCDNCHKRIRDPESHKAKISAAFAGDKHPRSKPLGSRRLHQSSDGCVYWVVKIAPTGKWPYEHRFVMVQKLGRPLLSTEHVHHDNHDTLDNRPDNLVLLDHGAHIALHHRLSEGKWALHYDACQKCSTLDRPHYSKGLCSACYQQEARLADPERYRNYDRARAPTRRENPA